MKPALAPNRNITKPIKVNDMPDKMFFTEAFGSLNATTWKARNTINMGSIAIRGKGFMEVIEGTEIKLVW